VREKSTINPCCMHKKRLKLKRSSCVLMKSPYCPHLNNRERRLRKRINNKWLLLQSLSKKFMSNLSSR
jgi:hypothetical protein